jgi:hypothetical protein
MDRFGRKSRSTGADRCMTEAEAGLASKVVVNIQIEEARLTPVTVLPFYIIFACAGSCVGHTHRVVVTATSHLTSTWSAATRPKIKVV